MKIFCLFFLLSNFLYSYFEFEKIGARQVGAGGSKVILSDDVNSSFLNPAGLGFVNRTAFSVSFSIPYWIENLYSGYLSFALPTKFLNLGISSYFLFIGKDYSEKLFNISVAKSFSLFFTAGINFKIFNISVSPLPIQDPSLIQNLTRVSFDVGLFSKNIAKNFVFGICLKNIIPSEFNFFKTEKGDTLKQVLIAGIGYYPIEEFVIFFEPYYIMQKMGFIIGAEFSMYKTIFLRAGYSSDIYNFGIGIKTKYITGSFAFSSHQYLSNTYLVDLTFEL